MARPRRAGGALVKGPGKTAEGLDLMAHLGGRPGELKQFPGFERNVVAMAKHGVIRAFAAETRRRQSSHIASDANAVLLGLPPGAQAAGSIAVAYAVNRHNGLHYAYRPYYSKL